MNLEAISKQLGQYAEVFKVFKEAEVFTRHLNEEVFAASTVLAETEVVRGELVALEEKLVIKKEEYTSLVEKLQEKEETSRKSIEELAENKVNAALTKAAEILKKANEQFHESTYKLRLLQEDEKGYETRISEHTQTLEGLEIRIARAKKQIQGILGEEDGSK